MNRANRPRLSRISGLSYGARTKGAFVNTL